MGEAIGGETQTMRWRAQVQFFDVEGPKKGATIDTRFNLGEIGYIADSDIWAWLDWLQWQLRISVTVGQRRQRRVR